MDRKSKIRENDPFRVPEGYFDNVSEQIMDRIGDKEEKPAVRRSLARTLRPALMLAAAMTGLVIISYAGLKMLFPDKGNEAGIEYAEISDYEMYSIDEATIMEFLTEEEESGEFPVNEEDNEINDDIINYLLDNNIDYSTILEQF